MGFHLTCSEDKRREKKSGRGGRPSRNGPSRQESSAVNRCTKQRRTRKEWSGEMACSRAGIKGWRQCLGMISQGLLVICVILHAKSGAGQHEAHKTVS